MELADSVADTVEDVGVTKRERNDTGDAGRCVKQSAKKRYTGKRKYCGNQYTKVKGANSNTTPVSHKKVKYVKKRKTDNNEGYRLFDIQIFEDIVSSLACPDCFEKGLYVEENPSKKKGFACFISVMCEHCDYVKETYTSKEVDKQTVSQGMNPYEINIRAVYASRSCGLGHTGLEKLCCALNLPKPMTVMNYNKVSNYVRDATKLVAETSMNNAVRDLKKGSTNVVDIGVTVDGSWQRRGFSSMNGVVVQYL